MASSTWTAPRMWEDGRCFVIGGGPSIPGQFAIPDDIVSKVRNPADPAGPELYAPYMQMIHEEHIIGANNAYLLGDWVDVCHFGDHGWYKVHRDRLSRWPGIKVTHVPAFADPGFDNGCNVKFMERDRRRLGLSSHPARLCWNFNTGASAIDLAAHLGARKIILLGFDMSHSGTSTHWHAGHGHVRQSYARFLRGFPMIAADAQRMGLEIINASPSSAITEFPRVSLKEALS